MADRSNHYERAFESYLRSLRVPCIPVDETRRTIADNEAIKSLDFIVMLASGGTLLLDVKGRRVSDRRTTLENWTTQEDLDALLRWQALFGERSQGVFAFVYHLPSDERKEQFETSFSHADRHYGCLAVSVAEYREHVRVRSTKWRTVSVPSSAFIKIAKPMSFWIGGM